MVSTSFIVAALSTLPMSFAYYYPPANGTTLMPQPTATGGAAKPTGGAAKATHTVAVGQNGLTFTPDTIHANVGEDVVFQFFPKNHSVVQSDFASPCVAKEGGIFSGFTFNTTQGTAESTFTVTVSDEKPVWLYCSQNQPKPHCAAGMVAVINPPAQGPNTLAAFKEAAVKTNTSTSPAGGVSGGKVSTPGTPSSPGSPSGTPSNAPAESTGAASSIQVSGALGAFAFFAGLLL